MTETLLTASGHLIFFKKILADSRFSEARNLICVVVDTSPGPKNRVISKYKLKAEWINSHNNSIKL